jgi:ankyrin repeat protein
MDTTFSQALIEAAKIGDRRSILQLLMRGADIRTTDNDGNTLLMIAIKNQQDSLCVILVSLGVDLKAKNKFGETTISLATKFKSKRKFFLLTAGAI